MGSSAPPSEACGSPYATPGPAPGATQAPTQPNPGSVNATDQYVPKHFPFPWFASSTAIPITPAQFGVIDEEGRLHNVHVSNFSGGALPAELKPGVTVDLEIYAVLPTGEGRIIWAPIPEDKPVVQWDYDNELD